MFQLQIKKDIKCNVGGLVGRLLCVEALRFILPIADSVCNPRNRTGLKRTSAHVGACLFKHKGGKRRAVI